MHYAWFKGKKESVLYSRVNVDQTYTEISTSESETQLIGTTSPTCVLPYS